MSLFHFGDSAEHGHVHGTMVEALDPRVKLVGALALALWVGLLPRGHEALLAVLGVLLVVVGGLAQIPPGTLLVRASAALPFVGVPALLGLATGSFDGPTVLAMAGRGYTTAMIATLLVSVTPFPALLGAASALGVPDLVVSTTALVYRYLVLLRARAAAIAASARARGYGVATPGRFAVGGAMLGNLLLDGLDRADRVHGAMLARGYTGRMPSPRTLRMRGVDWAAGAALLGAIGGSLVWLR